MKPNTAEWLLYGNQYRNYHIQGSTNNYSGRHFKWIIIKSANKQVLHHNFVFSLHQLKHNKLIFKNRFFYSFSWFSGINEFEIIRHFKRADCKSNKTTKKKCIEKSLFWSLYPYFPIFLRRILKMTFCLRFYFVFTGVWVCSSQFTNLVP